MPVSAPMRVCLALWLGGSAFGGEDDAGGEDARQLVHQRLNLLAQRFEGGPALRIDLQRHHHMPVLDAQPLHHAEADDVPLPVGVDYALQSFQYLLLARLGHQVLPLHPSFAGRHGSRCAL